MNVLLKSEFASTFSEGWGLLKTLASGCFQGFLEKKRLNARGFAREYLRSCTGYRPGRSIKRHGQSSSMHSKNCFCLGGAGVLWVTSKVDF